MSAAAAGVGLPDGAGVGLPVGGAGGPSSNPPAAAASVVPPGNVAPASAAGSAPAAAAAAAAGSAPAPDADAADAAAGSAPAPDADAADAAAGSAPAPDADPPAAAAVDDDALEGLAFIHLDPIFEADATIEGKHSKNRLTNYTPNGKEIPITTSEGDDLTRLEYMEDKLYELMGIISAADDSTSKTLYSNIESFLIQELKSRNKFLLEHPDINNIGIRQARTLRHSIEDEKKTKHQYFGTSVDYRKSIEKSKYIMARLPTPAIAFLILLYRVNVKFVNYAKKQKSARISRLANFFKLTLSIYERPMADILTLNPSADKAYILSYSTNITEVLQKYTFPPTDYDLIKLFTLKKENPGNPQTILIDITKHYASATSSAWSASNDRYIQTMSESAETASKSATVGLVIGSGRKSRRFRNRRRSTRRYRR